MRQLSQEVIIWTEMIHVNAVLKCQNKEALLIKDCEGPVIF